MRTKFLPLIVLALAGLPFPAAAQDKLTVYTYDSFTAEWGPGPQVEKAFEAECGCDFQFVAVADGVALLNRLKRKAPRQRPTSCGLGCRRRRRGQPACSYRPALTPTQSRFRVAGQQSSCLRLRPFASLHSRSWRTAEACMSLSGDRTRKSCFRTRAPRRWPGHGSGEGGLRRQGSRPGRSSRAVF